MSASASPTRATTYSFPRSPSPANAHPYAVKTTSAGILSRANSSPQRPSLHKSHYVPSTPKTEKPARQDGNRHRYSRSMNSTPPRPLPAPPPLSADAPNPSSKRFFRRSETLPTPPPSISSIRSVFKELESPPSNPRQWSPSQLSAYLVTALRANSGDDAPMAKPVARDIAKFVLHSRITGRTFLKLTDADLEEYDISRPWRTALLTASNDLRQNMDFWAADESALSKLLGDEGDHTPIHRRRRSQSMSTIAAQISIPSTYPIPSSSSSAVDLFSPRTMGGRFRSGRVKGMVESFEIKMRERSGSMSSTSSDYGLDSSPTISRFMVSSSDGLDESHSAVMFGQRPLPAPPPLLHQPALPVPLSVSPVAPSDTEEYETAYETTVSEVDEQNEDEPTMEQLLAAGSGGGAQAWYNADVNGLVTVKSIPNHSPSSTIDPTQTWKGSKDATSAATEPVIAPKAVSPERPTALDIFASSPRPLPRTPGPPSPVHVLSAPEQLQAMDQNAPLCSSAVAPAAQESTVVPASPPAESETFVNDYKPHVIQPLANQETGETQILTEITNMRRLEEMARVQQLEQSVERTRTSVQSFGQMLEHTERKIADMEQAFDEQRSENAHLHEKVDNLRVQLAETQHLLDSEKQQVEQMKQHLQQVEHQKQETQQALEKSEERLRLAEDRQRLDVAAPSLPPPPEAASPLALVYSRLTRIYPLSSILSLVSSVHTGVVDSLFVKKRKNLNVCLPHGIRDLRPKRIRDLPSYLFLVGLGVCAVVLRVVLRRTVNRSFK